MNRDRVRDKLRRGARLRVLFLNDAGFQYGAGMAHLRQIQSFLLMGHEVKGLCWTQGIEGDIPFVPHKAPGHWAGMRQLRKVHPENGYDPDAIISAVMNEVTSIEPDLIIVGNLHFAGWPLELLLALRESDSLVVTYMHDCYLISGRCAYPGSCTLYESGCSDRCPTIDEYPRIPAGDIERQWKLRRAIFCGPDGVPLATNSAWSLEMAKRSLPELCFADVVYLGLDEHLFKPIDRGLARKLLGLPVEGFMIIGGAVNVSDKRKGGHLFKKVMSSLGGKAGFIVFGHESLGIKGVFATGLLRDYRKMPLIFSAADIYVGTAIEEAFGQALCEAAACALPVVAFNVGGTPEAAIHDLNARLVDDTNVDRMLEEIDFFMQNPGERATFGRAGRAMVESKFTLRKQGERWMEYLRKVALC